jgi:putative oxidoreductase
MNGTTRFLPFAGRLLIGGIFLMSGLAKIPAYAGITAAISGTGLPFAPLGFALALVVEIGLGLLLLLGYRVRPAALVATL